MLVVFEEIGGDPTKISFTTKQVGSICSHVSESHPPPVDMWNTDQTGKKSVPTLSLECPSSNQVISSIKFVSFGTPQGSCGSYAHGTCRSLQAQKIVQKVGYPYTLDHLSVYLLISLYNFFHFLKFVCDLQNLPIDVSDHQNFRIGLCWSSQLQHRSISGHIW